MNIDFDLTLAHVHNSGSLKPLVIKNSLIMFQVIIVIMNCHPQSLTLLAPRCMKRQICRHVWNFVGMRGIAVWEWPISVLKRSATLLLVLYRMKDHHMKEPGCTQKSVLDQQVKHL